MQQEDQGSEIIIVLIPPSLVCQPVFDLVFRAYWSLGYQDRYFTRRTLTAKQVCELFGISDYDQNGECAILAVAGKSTALEVPAINRILLKFPEILCSAKMDEEKIQQSQIFSVQRK